MLGIVTMGEGGGEVTAGAPARISLLFRLSAATSAWHDPSQAAVSCLLDHSLRASITLETSCRYFETNVNLLLDFKMLKKPLQHEKMGFVSTGSLAQPHNHSLRPEAEGKWTCVRTYCCLWCKLGASSRSSYGRYAHMHACVHAMDAGACGHAWAPLRDSLPCSIKLQHKRVVRISSNFVATCDCSQFGLSGFSTILDDGGK